MAIALESRRDPDVAYAAAVLREVDSTLAFEVREHLVARLDEWEKNPAPSAAMAERRRRYQLLATALGAAR